MNKRKDAKYHGGENNDLGIEYEIRFAIKKLVEMLLPNKSGVRIVKVTRQKKELVDDVIVERSNKTKVFHQCKRSKSWIKKTMKNTDENNLWLDFLAQHGENSFSELVLVTQNKDLGLDDLANLSKNNDDITIFKQELQDDMYHKEALGKFTYLLSLVNEENDEPFVFAFLKKFRIASYDDYFTKEDTIKGLMTYFSDIEAENIFNSFHAKLNSDWLGKEITRAQLIEELNRLKINTNNIDLEEKPVDASTVPQVSSVHFLKDASATFSQKLDYLLRLINQDKSLSKKEILQAIKIIASDDTLSWHFLKNLNDPNWFPRIKDNVIKAIVEQTEDSAAKFQLLNFFEKCAKNYSDEIVPFLYSLEKNTQSYQILSSLLKTFSFLKPKSPESIKLIWTILTDLVEHQHPWVRREVPSALLSFVDVDIDKVIELFNKLFSYNPPPQDVTQGSLTLALTFQGTDNENWVFEEAIKAFSELLSNPMFAQKAHLLAIDIEKKALQEEKKTHDSEQGITLDYSSIWLSDKSFDSERLEYNHDRKERVALEIEKSLDKLTPINVKLVSSLLSKLLEEKYEIFHLIVIKVLIRHIQTYIELTKSLVFDNSLWLVYNIRNYFLQTLIANYFKTSNGVDLAKFVTEVDEIKLKDPKKTLYLKQDLYVSVPEEKRYEELSKKIAEVSKALEIKPEISKPFAVTTWSGIRPDITIEELKTKTEGELVQIMVDSSTGKRAASYDTAPVFAQLIDQNPELLQGLLKKMTDKDIAPDFAGEMIEAYRKKCPQDISGIADLINLLGKQNAWAKIEIARYFNEICRKKEILDYEGVIIDKIRYALLVLTKDGNPESDNTSKSNNPKPGDAITRGINSVRGIATEALVAFCHYFPADKESAGKIIDLADDSTNAVKATLIYYLRYLVGNNFPLCETVINRFKDQRDPEIDFALIHFFAQLDCEKFIKYQDFIKLLFNNTNEQISEDLGELVGYRFINGCDVQALLDNVIGNRKGTKRTIRSLAFVFESQMGSMIGNERDKQIAGYLKKLMSPQNDFEVVERASFVFQRDEIKPEHFEFLDQNGLTTELLLNRLNIPAQSHLVDYLQRCIEANVSIDRCIEILHEQITNIGPILSDHLIANKISTMVAKLIKADLSSKTKELLLDIFNEGLERGWDEFYAIYFDLKKKS
jgi:hypothetical protein